jgi:hypothetical protein
LSSFSKSFAKAIVLSDCASAIDDEDTIEVVYTFVAMLVGADVRGVLIR